MTLPFRSLLLHSLPPLPCNSQASSPVPQSGCSSHPKVTSHLLVRSSMYPIEFQETETPQVLNSHNWKVSEEVTSEIEELKTHSVFRQLLSCHLLLIWCRREKTTEINPLCTPAVAFIVRWHSLYPSSRNAVTDLLCFCCARHFEGGYLTLRHQIKPGALCAT